MNRVRQVVMFGLLGYLASFLFVGGNQQKTLFYLVVALPSVFLLADLRQISRDYKTPTLLILGFLAFFWLSSLWSAEGQFLNSLKLALIISCLMIASHTIMRMRADAAKWVCYYVLIVGIAASIFYLSIILYKASAADGYAHLLSSRFTLRDGSGWGDGNPINSSVYFGLISLAAWWLFPRSRSSAKLGLLLLIAACLAIMFLSKSRGPILSLGLAVILISTLRRSRDDLLLGAGVLVFGSAAVAFFDLMPLVLDRANAPNYRAEIWSHSIELIKNNLFFGQGVGTSADIPFPSESGAIVTVTHSHSSPLEAFRLGGLVGGGLFLALVIEVLRRSLTASHDRGFFAVWLIYGLLCLSTNGRSLFIRPSVEWFAFWIPLFLALFASPKDALPGAPLRECDAPESQASAPGVSSARNQGDCP